MQHVTERHVEPLPETTDATELSQARRVVLALAGMGCANCANRIRNALLRTPGVLAVRIDLHGSLVRVWCRSDPPVHEVSLTEAVVAAGRETHHRYLAVPLRSRFAEHAPNTATP